jgi:hypothetical protein
MDACRLIARAGTLSPNVTWTERQAERILNRSWMDNSEKESQFTLEKESNDAFTTKLASFIVPETSAAGNVSFTVSPASRPWRIANLPALSGSKF